MGLLQTKQGRIRLAIVLAVLLLLLSVGFYFLWQRGYRTISISELNGNVLAEDGGRAFIAYPNMNLHEGHALATLRESYARMVLDGDKYVKLEAESRAIFEGLGRLSRGNTAIYLERGVLTNELTRPLEGEQSYIVNTPNAVLAVRGTFFRVEVWEAENGEILTDVDTYGGTVVCQRILPDGTLVDEQVLIEAGYKTTISMDEIETVYVIEEVIPEKEHVEPIIPAGIPDRDVVDMYEAGVHGHEMFLPPRQLWDMLEERGIDIEDHHSQYDQSPIPPIEEIPEEVVGAPADDPAEEPEQDASSGAGEETADGFPLRVTPSPNPEATSLGGADPMATPLGGAGSAPGATLAPAAMPAATPAPTPSASPSASPSPSPSATPAPSGSPELDAGEDSAGESSGGDSGSSSGGGSGSGSGDASGGDGAHTHTEVTTTVAATCGEDGVETVSCSECGEVLSTTVIEPATGLHTPMTDEIPSSVAGEPSGAHTYCGVCNETISRTIGINSDNFPDVEFRPYITAFDTDGDGALSEAERNAVTSIDFKNAVYVTDTTGIEHFPELRELRGSFNGNSNTKLDVSANTKLEVLYCYTGDFTTLDLSNNTALRSLHLEYPALSQLNLSSNTALESLDLWYMHELTTLDLSANTALKSVLCYGLSQLTGLDVSHNTALTSLDVSATDFASLDVSQNTELEELIIYSSAITQIDVSNNTKLVTLQAGYAELACLNLENNTTLTTLSCSGNVHEISAPADGTVDLKSLGAVPGKVSNVSGANYDNSTGIMTGVTAGSTITYTYELGNGSSETFTLRPV